MRPKNCTMELPQNTTGAILGAQYNLACLRPILMQKPDQGMPLPRSQTKQAGQDEGQTPHE